MCGIVGYLGSDIYKEYILSGLRYLQNRGYDSVGVSCVENGNIHTTKFYSYRSFDKFF